MFRIVWYASLSVAVTIAVIRGGRGERLTATFLMLLAGLTGVHQVGDWQLDAFEEALDVSLFVFLLTLALRSDRWWPLYACAAQLGAIVAGLADILSLTRSTLAYRTATACWSYVILAALCIGTLAEQARVHEERRPPS